MNYRVECAIKTAKTDISCEIEFRQVSQKDQIYLMNWGKVGGRLDIGADKGRWFYLKIKGETKGVVIFPHKEGDESNKVFSDTDRLVTLNDVPDRFVEIVGCGTDLSGDGILHATGEKVFWKMYHSCI